MTKPFASARPVLGVTCCTRQVGTEPAQAVINRYVVAAMRYGDVAALLVPALPELMSAREVASRLDGVLLTGSPSNMEPARYGEAGAVDAEGPYDAGRDAMSGDLIRAMLDLGKPVLGVCRGFQEINVALGGTLRRDTSRNPALLAHHAPEGHNAVPGVIRQISYLGSESVYEVAVEGGGTIKALRSNLTRRDQEDFTWDEPVWLAWHACSPAVLLS